MGAITAAIRDKYHIDVRLLLTNSERKERAKFMSD
jgi:hypothetical protein